MSLGKNATTARHVWLGLIEGPSGYADEARGFLRALERSGHEPAARHLFGSTQDAKLGPMDRAMLRKQLARDAGQAEVAVHHYAPAWMRQAPVVENIPNVARTMFETDRLPSAWVPQLLTRDEVWVPCEHNRESFERGGVPAGRLRVVGGTIDFELFRPGAESLDLGTPPGHLVFLSNFEFSERKAWRELLMAWARAFSPTDPVCLVLKTTGGKEAALGPQLEAALRDVASAAGRPRTAAVQLLSHTFSPEELVRMYAAADAYVLASRGEGWGRPYMEALAMGLPTIASRWSGPQEFMRDTSSWLVDGRLVPVPAEHGVFADDVTGHRWFEPDIDTLSAALVEIADDPQASRRRAAEARSDLIDRFGPDPTARRLEAAICDVAGRARRLRCSGRECSIRGLFGRNASLSIVNDRLVDELEAVGRRVHARPLGAPYDTCVGPTISHSWPPDFSAGSRGPSVVILPWEYGRPPVEWVERVCRDVDRVIVPSEYVRHGYVAGGMPPGIVEVVPNGVDLKVMRPDGPKLSLPERASCVFLFVGGTIWRKGIDLLMAAWQKAFSARDDVLLVVKDFGVQSHYRDQTSGEAIRAIAREPDVAPVIYLDEEVPANALPNLYRAADVLVAPYRGEGFGMPILEAMACGVPAIHTGTGPSAEFVGAGGWTVPATRLNIGTRLGDFALAGEGYVHETNVEALAQALQSVAAAPHERALRGRAAVGAASQYGWDRVAGLLERSLSTLTAEGLAYARDTQPIHFESRGRTVLYAPSWETEGSWGPALERWVSTVPVDADVSLVMPVKPAQAETVMQAVLRRLEIMPNGPEDLPDLVLHQQAHEDLSGLVAVADAVLLDGAQACDPPPALWRRARRVITPAGRDLEEYAATLGRLPNSEMLAA
jgi:glycosyltransferase involved in cell wall biosynthesis